MVKIATQRITPTSTVAMYNSPILKMQTISPTVFNTGLTIGNAEFLYGKSLVGDCGGEIDCGRTTHNVALSSAPLSDRAVHGRVLWQGDPCPLLVSKIQALLAESAVPGSTVSPIQSRKRTRTVDA